MYDYQNLLSQNRLLSDAVKRRVDYLAAINTVATSVSQSLDLNKTLQTALQAVLKITEAEAGGISLIETQSGDVVLRAQKGWIHDFVGQNPMRIPHGEGMSGQLIQMDDVIVENELDGSQNIAIPEFYDEAFRSIVMAPMHARSKIIGILSIMSFQPNRFDDEVIGVLRVIADTVGIALDNARLYESSLENQLQLSAILHSTADGIIATDCTGRIRLINQAAAAALAVDADQLIGTMLRNAPIPMRIRESLQFMLSSRGESSRSFTISLENGQVLTVVASEIMVESLVDQRIDTEGWVIVLQDVTHLHEAEMARTRFIQAAAHDMRNPLGTVINALDMLERRLQPTDPTISEIIAIAVGSVERLQGLIDDLFNLENIQNGYGFNLEDVDIGELIYEMSAGIRPFVEERGINYHVDLQAGIEPLHIDRRWVSRAISNYLDNAIKYTPPDSTITLRVFTEQAQLHVEVIDNGAGIAASTQNRLFERFYRAGKTDTIPGTGLGLAIVKSVAEAHGGSVYVKSSPGQGSVFGMTLPYEPIATV